MSALLAPLVQSVACTVQRTVPSSACARAIGSCGPLQRFGLARRNIDVLRRQLQARGLGLEPHLHGLRGGVAHGEQGHELVALAHHGGQAADQLQILGGGNRGAASAKAVVTLIGNGHNLKAGEGIIERHLHLGTALGIERHHGLPQQQGVKQFARIAATNISAPK